MEPFRPKQLGQLFGQDHLTPTLMTWIENPGSMPRSILFQGPYGTGKTSAAKILANRLCSIASDIKEINASEARGIDDVREWIDSSRFCPLGTAKVYILDEVQQQTKAAQAALLKVIEEPPKNTYFFLCTMEPGKLLEALGSRCTRLIFRLLDNDSLFSLLHFLAKNKVPKEVLQEIVENSGGHARDAVKYLEAGLVGGSWAQPPPAADNLLIQKLLSRFGKDPTVLQQLLQVSDDTMLANKLDDFLDSKILLPGPVASNYYQLLDLRSKRKQYLISTQEYLRFAYTLFQ